MLRERHSCTKVLCHRPAPKTSSDKKYPIHIIMTMQSMQSMQSMQPGVNAVWSQQNQCSPEATESGGDRVRRQRSPEATESGLNRVNAVQTQQRSQQSQRSPESMESVIKYISYR